MSLQSVTSRGDEYYTPDYVVEILLPYLKLKPEIKTIWCPCDLEHSEYVKVLQSNGYKVIHSHIQNGQDFLTYEPTEHYDAIITNPPFSIKNEVFKRAIELDKPFALLMSATSIQSASFINILKDAKDLNFILFDKRISYSGDRPPFPSWYYTSQLLDNNEFYIYEEDPKKLYRDWENRK